jgi:hypothetical protein
MTKLNFSHKKNAFFVLDEIKFIDTQVKYTQILHHKKDKFSFLAKFQ